ncbi:hypothetical protein DM02DRAFT_654769 [Periconia macrospinosa]|uniref:DNA helicase n=1 Tax=Periconia macrospinosa TaxID=97972 RepID=A0A2V1DS79_9PLEO|nr:hypothetical protein DM02DRAFT_654769 [Periconia macrospinosa]
MVMTAATIKKTPEQAERASTLTDKERIALEKGMRKSSLRVFDRMSRDREVCGVQVAIYNRLHTILDGRSYIESTYTICDADSRQFSSVRMMLIGKRLAKNRTTSEKDFHTDQPERREKARVVASVGRTVALVGQLTSTSRTGCQEVIQTLATQSDLTEVLSALFDGSVCRPFSTMLRVYAVMDADLTVTNRHTGLQACAMAWSRVRGTLPEHIQESARHVELLRKSKGDVDVDMAERKAPASAMQVAFNPDLDGNGTLDEPVCDNGSIDDDTLRVSIHTTMKRWVREASTASAGIRPLRQPWEASPSLSVENFTPTLIDSTSDIRQDRSDGFLKLWSDLRKGAKASNCLTENGDDDYGLNAGDEYAALEPVLTSAEPTTGPANPSARVGQNPSPLHTSDLISEALPLTTKQKRAVSMLFYNVLRLPGKQAVESDDRFILHVGGQGGTGRSRIIDAVRLGVKLLKRERELAAIGPTGNAARNVQGSTIRTGLNVAVWGRPNRGASSRVRSLRTEKIMLITDEVSMVGSKPMDSMGRQCKVVKGLGSNSTAVFGGLPIGGFHQFPPVRAKALWQKQESNDEQRRRHHDTGYRQLLQRARIAAIAQPDVDVLSTRVIAELESRTDRINTCIVRTNEFRHIINRLQNGKIFASSRGTRDLDADELLEVQDLMYTKNMPTAVLSNNSTPLGIVAHAVHSSSEMCTIPATGSYDQRHLPGDGFSGSSDLLLIWIFRNMSVTRHGTGVSSLPVADYEAQGGTWDAATLGLHRQNVSSKDRSSYNRYGSVHDQLARVRSAQDLSLVQRVTLADLNAKRDRLLLLEDQRLAELARSTEIAWEQMESTMDLDRLVET